MRGCSRQINSDMRSMDVITISQDLEDDDVDMVDLVSESDEDQIIANSNQQQRGQQQRGQRRRRLRRQDGGSDARDSAGDGAADSENAADNAAEDLEGRYDDADADYYHTRLAAAAARVREENDVAAATAGEQGWEADGARLAAEAAPAAAPRGRRRRTRDSPADVAGAAADIKHESKESVLTKSEQVKLEIVKSEPHTGHDSNGVKHESVVKSETVPIKSERVSEPGHEDTMQHDSGPGHSVATEQGAGMQLDMVASPVRGQQQQQEGGPRAAPRRPASRAGARADASPELPAHYEELLRQVAPDSAAGVGRQGNGHIQGNNQAAAGDGAGGGGSDGPESDDWNEAGGMHILSTPCYAHLVPSTVCHHA